MADKKLNIYEKLGMVQGMWLTFEKTANNPFFKSKYTPLDDINIKLKPILSDVGLVIIHYVAIGIVRTKVVDMEQPDSFIESHIAIPENITDPQKIGAMVTYAKRYNTVALFNLDTEPDDDGNGASSKKKEGSKPKQEAKEEKEVDWFSDKDFDNLRNSIMKGDYNPPDTAEELIKTIRKTRWVSKKMAGQIEDLYSDKD